MWMIFILCDMPHQIDLLGHNTPVSIITKEEIKKEFPLNISSFKIINKLTTEVLRSSERFTYNKIAISVHSGDEKYPTKLRTMMGEGDQYSGVRTFGANTKNTIQGRRRSNNLFCLYNNTTGDLISIMSGDAIADFRTASSVAVGVDAIGVPDPPYTVSILGIGAIGTAMGYALAALPSPPQTIRMVASRKHNFQSVRERIQHYIERTFTEPKIKKVDFMPCETLKEALSEETNIVVDTMALPYHQEIVNEHILTLKNRTHFIYADANKQALSASLVDQFHTHVFDSVKLARYLESSVGSTLKGRLEGSNVVSIYSLLNNESEASPLSTCTIMGLPTIDTKIGTLIHTRLQ